MYICFFWDILEEHMYIFFFFSGMFWRITCIFVLSRMFWRSMCIFVFFGMFWSSICIIVVFFWDILEEHVYICFFSGIFWRSICILIFSRMVWRSICVFVFSRILWRNICISNFSGIFWKSICIFIFSFWDILMFTGAVCISLGVSEKFQVVCCEDPTHGLIYGGTPATLNRRIMEISTFFERSAIFNSSLLKTGTVTMFDLAPPVTPLRQPICRHSSDMVHPTTLQLRIPCATLSPVREHLIVGRGMTAQSRSIKPDLGFPE